MSRRVMGGGCEKTPFRPNLHHPNCLCFSAVIYSVVDERTNAGIVGLEQYIRICLMHLFIIFYSVLYLYTQL